VAEAVGSDVTVSVVGWASGDAARTRSSIASASSRTAPGGGVTNRCDRSITCSTDCWKVSSVPVTDMTRMTMPAMVPAIR
jgi:hypothetical protein